MIYWIKKFARISGIICFFIVFFVSLDPVAPFEWVSLELALLKGGAAAVLFWFIGFIVGDMVFKGIVEGIGVHQVDEIEGGLLQRVRQTKEQQAIKKEPVADKG